MQPIAQFNVSEEGRNGTLTVFSDRVERASHGRIRKNTGMEIIPFSRMSSVQLDRGFRRQEVVIHAGGNAIRVKVYGNAEELVRCLNDGMAGRFSEQQAPAVQARVEPQGPPPGWYGDPGGLPVQRWWDGAQWTAHTQS